MREALTWFGIWIRLALVFNIGLVFLPQRGVESGLEFLTGFALASKCLWIDCRHNYIHVGMVNEVAMASWLKTPARDFDAS